MPFGHCIAGTEGLSVVAYVSLTVFDGARSVQVSLQPPWGEYRLNPDHLPIQSLEPV